jgi:NADH-quinone oxidoreductase subunit L
LLLAAYAMGLVAVFFTGFYTFRMVFLTFHGDPRTETARDPHGVRWNVKGPLVVLGVLAAGVGLINMTPVAKLLGIEGIEFLHKWFEHGLANVTVEHYGTLLHDVAGYTAGTVGSETLTVIVSAALSLGLALSGAGLAWRLYGVAEPVEHTRKLGAVRDVLFNNYYQDEYQVWLAESVVQPLSRAADKFDGAVVDGVVNGVSSVSLFAGSRVRRIQTGVVSNYAMLLTLGLTALLLAFAVMGGWFS